MLAFLASQYFFLIYPSLFTFFAIIIYLLRDYLNLINTSCAFSLPPPYSLSLSLSNHQIPISHFFSNIFSDFIAILSLTYTNKNIHFFWFRLFLIWFLLLFFSPNTQTHGIHQHQFWNRTGHHLNSIPYRVRDHPLHPSPKPATTAAAGETIGTNDCRWERVLPRSRQVSLNRDLPTPIQRKEQRFISSFFLILFYYFVDGPVLCIVTNTNRSIHVDQYYYYYYFG